MPPDYLLGIDLGTTTCRAALFDRHGRELALAAVETPVRYPRPLWAEADPEAWWHSVVAVTRAALEHSGVHPSTIAGIGLSGLMHAPVLLDGDGRPVAPSMLWMDQRCAPQCEAIRREAEAAGLRSPSLTSSVTGPKLRWLAEMQPKVLARAVRLLLPKDYVRFRLTGTLGTDPADAGGTGLFDRQVGTWRWELVELCRVPRHLLPEVQPPDTLAGRVTPEAAAATGLAPGTPVATGSSDTYCTRLGAGPLAPGEACLYLGTAAWVAIAAAVPADERRPAAGDSPLSAATASSPPRAEALRSFGATSTTGAALRWLRDLLVAPEPAAASRDHTGGLRPRAPEVDGARRAYDTLTREAEAVPLGAEGLLFLPHLMGERGPVADPLARGALVGLTLSHTRGHVVRAVIEGTAYHLRHLIETRSEGRWPVAGVACGGAARSALWMQVLADVLALPLRVPAVVETAALGAAVLGGAAAGIHTVEEAQQRMVHPGPRYAPDAGRVQAYATLYRRYRRLDDLLAPWFRESIEPIEPVR
jgi:xylulokinase